jgi:Fur family transcriptional regulator, zinc uptake regulator
MDAILVLGVARAKECLMGFTPRTETLLERASAICDSRGVRLTELRRQVLGLILNRESPTGAYDLLDQLRSTRHGAAPPTVYRALEFLQDQGLVHKL